MLAVMPLRVVPDTTSVQNEYYTRIQTNKTLH
jgi:hypothetical protein